MTDEGLLLTFKQLVRQWLEVALEAGYLISIILKKVNCICQGSWFNKLSSNFKSVLIYVLYLTTLYSEVKKNLVQNKERTDFHLMMFHGKYIKQGEKGNIDNQKGYFLGQDKKGRND